MANKRQQKRKYSSGPDYRAEKMFNVADLNEN